MRIISGERTRKILAALQEKSNQFAVWYQNTEIENANLIEGYIDYLCTYQLFSDEKIISHTLMYQHFLKGLGL